METKKSETGKTPIFTIKEIIDIFDKISEKRKLKRNG